MTDLMPCPFCGGKDMKWEDEGMAYGTDHIECKRCHARGPWADSYDEAVRLWNEGMALHSCKDSMVCGEEEVVPGTGTPEPIVGGDTFAPLPPLAQGEEVADIPRVSKMEHHLMGRCDRLAGKAAEALRRVGELSIELDALRKRVEALEAKSESAQEDAMRKLLELKEGDKEVKE